MSVHCFLFGYFSVSHLLKYLITTSIIDLKLHTKSPCSHELHLPTPAFKFPKLRKNHDHSPKLSLSLKVETYFCPGVNISINDEILETRKSYSSSSSKFIRHSAIHQKEETE